MNKKEKVYAWILGGFLVLFITSVWGILTIREYQYGDEKQAFRAGKKAGLQDTILRWATVEPMIKRLESLNYIHDGPNLEIDFKFIDKEAQDKWKEENGIRGGYGTIVPTQFKQEDNILITHKQTRTHQFQSGYMGYILTYVIETKDKTPLVKWEHHQDDPDGRWEHKNLFIFMTLNNPKYSFGIVRIDAFTLAYSWYTNYVDRVISFHPSFYWPGPQSKVNPRNNILSENKIELEIYVLYNGPEWMTKYTPQVPKPKKDKK